MKLLLVAPPSLRPYLDRLIPDSPHEIEVFFRPEGSLPDYEMTAPRLFDVHHYDAVIYADGANILPDEGLTAGKTQLVFPRVHNFVSLLLGGAQAYRSLFARFNGEIGWALPENLPVAHFTPAADCSCICYLADTTLGLRDSSLAALETAQVNEWDYFHVESDLSLLRRLLGGDWEGEDILVVSKNASVFPSYRSNILV